MYVTRIVFFAGIVLASFGLSIFGDLLSMANLESQYQIGLLRISDILVTGDLLGGGSAGLNLVANKVSDYISVN